MLPRFLLLSAVTFFSTSSLENLVGDEAEVRDAIKAYVTAFNAKDLATIDKLWAENAVYVDHQLGERTEGRAQIVGDIKAVFEASGILNLAGTVKNVRMVRDDVATVDGEVMLTLGDAPTVTEFSALLVKQDKAWIIDSMEERAVVLPTSASDALAELGWLVGSWQDAAGESPVRATVRLAIGGSFLVRSFEATSEDGTPLQSTQIIGWDPRALQFRSWTFDADGSFGDGIWSKNDDQWLIKSSQTLADGRAASGTYVMTPKDQNSFTVQLIGRDIEGEPQPASAVLTVERVEVPASADNAAPTPSR